MRFLFSLLVIAACMLPSQSVAQDRIASPRGEASTQVGGAYDSGRYSGGKWIVVDYGRPILRGRQDLFGSGDSYGEALNSGAPVWRTGANHTTRFTTEASLSFGDMTLPAGEYTLFVDLAEDNWTLIISNHKAKAGPRTDDEGLWGSFGYEQEMDALRVPMTLSKNDMSVDQFTILFADMTQQGGKLVMMWDREMASVDFTVHAQ